MESEFPRLCGERIDMMPTPRYYCGPTVTAPGCPRRKPMASHELDVEHLPRKPLGKERPTVFYFQPTAVITFDQKSLHIWEEWMRKYVGLPLEAGTARLLMDGGHRCTGTASGDAGMDDCD